MTALRFYFQLASMSSETPIKQIIGLTRVRANRISVKTLNPIHPCFENDVLQILPLLLVLVRYSAILGFENVGILLRKAIPSLFPIKSLECFFDRNKSVVLDFIGANKENPSLDNSMLCQQSPHAEKNFSILAFSDISEWLYN